MLLHYVDNWSKAIVKLTEYGIGHGRLLEVGMCLKYLSYFIHIPFSHSTWFI